MSQPTTYNERNLHLNSKFSISFLIVAFLVIGIVALGDWGIKLTFQSSQTLVDEQLPSVLRLQNILGSVTNIHKGIQHVLGNSSPSDVHSTMVFVESQTALLKTDYPAYLAQPRYSEQTAQVQHLQADLDPWLQNLQTMTSLATANIPQTDRDTQMRAIYKTWQYGTIQISGDLQQLIAMNIKETTNNIHQSEMTGNYMIGFITVVGSIAMLMSIFLGVLLARMVIKPVDVMSAINTALRSANIQLEALATTDPLTELMNHRAVAVSLEQEIERAQRYKRNFSLLFLDIDHFKALNDTYGHVGGDEVLTAFAGIVKRTLRHVDVVGRWGGEEFLVILPETDEMMAMQAAERVRSAVAMQIFPLGGGLNITCSIGVASFRRDGFNRESLLTAVDHAMYAAKQLGRNQVRSASDLAVKSLLEENSQSREEIALLGTVEALEILVMARDQYTGEHTRKVGQTAYNIAVTMGCSHEEAQAIGLAGRLHDIGKVAVSDAILCKTGPLTESEWATIRTHPIVGAEVISYVPSLRPLAPLIRYHHERWAGGGYPDNLQGESIPLGARIIAVADAFDAMITDRPYQPARSVEEALAEIVQCSGVQFDPGIVVALKQMINHPPNNIEVIHDHLKSA